MGLSDIIERIKSALGMGGSGRRRRRQRGQQPRQSGRGQAPQRGQQQQHEGGQQQQPRAARQSGRQQGAPRHGVGQGRGAGTGATQSTGSGAGQNPPHQQGETDTVDVTVEREPDTASEDAVKGTDTSGEPVTESIAAEEIQNGTGGTDTGSGESSAQGGGAGTDESVDVIKGIGPTYAERLGEAGIETVADLAESALDDVAERADVPRGRLETWIERARHRD